jgi:hypothetical protein
LAADHDFKETLQAALWKYHLPLIISLIRLDPMLFFLVILPDPSCTDKKIAIGSSDSEVSRLRSHQRQETLNSGIKIFNLHVLCLKNKESP